MIYRMFSYCIYLTNAKKSRSAFALHTKKPCYWNCVRKWNRNNRFNWNMTLFCSFTQLTIHLFFFLLHLRLNSASDNNFKASILWVCACTHVLLLATSRSNQTVFLIDFYINRETPELNTFVDKFVFITYKLTCLHEKIKQWRQKSSEMKILFFTK